MLDGREVPSKCLAGLLDQLHGTRPTERARIAGLRAGLAHAR
jgi:hypothetical protein